MNKPPVIQTTESKHDRTNWPLTSALATVAFSAALAAVVLFFYAREAGVRIGELEAELTRIKSKATTADSTPTDQDVAFARSLRPAETQQTSGQVVTYNLDLKEGEVASGHGSRLQEVSDVGAFMFVGPGAFTFTLQSGIWYRYTNTTPQFREALVQKELDIKIHKYNHEVVRVVRVTEHHK